MSYDHYLSVMWMGASEAKEIKLNEWLELSRKWCEMDKEMNKTPNMITESQNLLIEFSLSVTFFIPFFVSKNPSMHPVMTHPYHVYF